MADDRKRSWDKITRASAIVTVLCLSPLYFLFSGLGDPGKGVAALACASVPIVVCRVFWDWYKCVWFWVALTGAVSLQLPLVLFVKWGNKSYPGVVLLPLGLADLALVYGCFALAQKITKRTGNNSSNQSHF